MVSQTAAFSRSATPICPTQGRAAPFFTQSPNAANWPHFADRRTSAEYTYWEMARARLQNFPIW
jgi:hypothetical protein